MSDRPQGPAGRPGHSDRAVGSERPGALGRAVSIVLPGAAQLREGRWGAGGTALLTWVGLLAVLVFRFERVVVAPRGPWDQKLAFLVLFGGLAASWVWSWRASSPGPGPDTTTYWAVGKRAFARNRVAVVGAMVILFMYAVAALAPFLAPRPPNLQGDLLAERLLGFTWAHPLGTDDLARDVLARLLYGARISLTIGFVAVGISVTIGTVVGAIAGFAGGWVDGALMRVVDMVIAFPKLVLLILIISLFDPSIFLIVVVLGLTFWPSTARIVRSEVLSLREREFVQAAEALGFSKLRVLFRHVVPNAMAPVIVGATLGIGNTIVLEAGLSFLGIGVQAPTASWGTMIADGRGEMLGAWWLATVPGLAIVVTVLAFNVVGDGLRDALDPRLRS